MVQSLGEANSLSARQQIPAFYGAHMFINTLRTGDADLRF